MSRSIERLKESLACTKSLELRRSQASIAPVSMDEARLREILKTHMEEYSARCDKDFSQAVARLEMTFLEEIRDMRETFKSQTEMLKIEVAQLSTRVMRDSDIKSLDERQQVVHREVQKALSVLPLVTCCDCTWMNKDTADSFYSLASLGLNEQVKPADMRQVARVCAMIGRAAGPCEQLAGFIASIQQHMEVNPDHGVRLIDRIEQLWMLLRNQPEAKSILQSVLLLADSEILEEATALLLCYAHLDNACLAEFSNTILHFLTESTSSRDEWLQALLGILTPWPKGHLEQIKALLQTIAKRSFDSTSLLFVNFVQRYLSCDISLLLTFIIRVNALLHNPEVVPELHNFLQIVVEHTKKIQDSKEGLEQTLLALRLVQSTSTSTELGKFAHMFNLLQHDNQFKTANLLMEIFAEFKDEEALIALSLGALDWLQTRENTAIKEALVEALQIQFRSSEENAKETGELLANLEDLKYGYMLEQQFPRILGCLPLDQTLLLAVPLIPLAKALGPALSPLLESLLDLLETSLSPLELGASLSLLLRTQEAFTLFSRLTKLSNVKLVSSILNCAQMHQEDKTTLSACAELSTLLYFFERDHVSPIEIEAFLYQKPGELIQLVQFCLPLVQNPANCMINLVSELFNGLNSKIRLEKLLYIAYLALDMLPKASSARIEELGRLFLAVSSDDSVERLEVGLIPQDKLEKLVTSQVKLTIEALEHTSQGLVQVTDSFMRFYDFQADIWGSNIPFKGKIQANSTSSWVILENSLVFCSGGEYSVGRFSQQVTSFAGIKPVNCAGNKAYLLGCQGQVKQLPRMDIARYFHGVIEVESRVYVFGGCRN